MRTVNIILISIIIIIAFAGEFVAGLELQPIEQPFQKEIIPIDSKLDFYKDYDRIVKIYDKEHDYNITIESTQIMKFDPVKKLKWSYDFAGEDILYSPYGLTVKDNKICSYVPTKYILKYNIGYVSRIPIYNCIFYPDGKTSEKDTEKVSFLQLDKNNIKAQYLDNYDPWQVQTGDSNGLVLWMKFDGNTTDEAGTAESFTTYNDANFSIHAKIGSHSAFFDGDGDKFMSNSPSYSLGTDTNSTLPFTISVWAKVAVNSTQDNTLYSEMNEDTFTTSTTSNRLQHMTAYNGTADAIMLYTNGAFDMVWTHYVLMHNSTHTCMYNNSYEGYCESRPGSMQASESGGYVSFGEKRYGSRDTYGYIDDVCVWHNVTFNASLIADLYTAGVSGTSCGDWYMSLSGEACTPNWLNTSWSAWTNDTQCNDTTPTYNQSRYLIQYDNNTCAGSTNTTHYEYNTSITCDECVPQYTNTSWSAWTNITACNGTHLIQQRNLTQFFNISCIGASNTTFYENQTIACTIDTLQVTNIQITPNLSITRFDNYNISALITGVPTTVILNLTHYTNGVQSCFEYSFGGVCLENGTSEYVMHNLSATNWFNQTRPDDLYPAMEFIDDEAYWNHSNQLTDIRHDNYMIFNITSGFSTYPNMSIFVEIDARVDAQSDRALELYIISWDQPFSIFNTSWKDNTSTQILCTVGTNDAKDHIHNVNSSHHVCPLTIDNSNLWNGINLSNGMYLAVYQERSQVNKAWDMAYLNSSKCNQSQIWYIGDYDAGTYTYSQGCPALHLHGARRYGIVDQISALVCADTTCNSTLFSFADLDNVAPLALGIITPANETISGSYNITTYGCTDPNGDTLTYTYKLYSTAGAYLSTIASSQSKPYYYWDTTTVTNGTYDLQVTCCDPSSSCAYMYQSDFFGNFTIGNPYTPTSSSLSAEQASCILNGTYTDGTYCAIGRANMGGLAITIFMLSVAGALLITPRIIKQFHEHWFPDLIIRRGLVIVGIYTMVLASATMATISEAYGLGLERTFMYTFIPVFGWVGYILMIWLGFQAIVDATKMYKDKRAEDYGWK